MSQGTFQSSLYEGEHGTNSALGVECGKKAEVSAVLLPYMVCGGPCEAVVSGTFAPNVVYGGHVHFPVTLPLPSSSSRYRVAVPSLEN